MSQAEASNYVNRQVQVAERLLGRPLGVNVELALKHYKNRPVVPFVIAQDLKSAELAQIRGVRPAGFVLQPLYLRYYPNETIAGHLIGFVGRRGRFLTGPLEDNEPLWPPNEGRDGLEQAFDEQLSGKPGVLQVSFDAQGRRSAERVSTPPTPGSNVVTTIDLRLQRAVESSLAKAGRPCAMVITDPNNGDVLAMASYPTVNPNWYVPTMPGSFYKTLDDDPKKPLIARAFRSSYPPGSTFKVFVGLAVMNAEIIDPDDRFGCPAVMEIGNLKFRNHRRSDSGSLNFAEALTQSCNTYFYKIGLKAGYRPIVDLCQRLGLGARTGIPIQAEEDGRLMTTEYMLKRYNRPVAPGDIANLSIGQGDTLVTPLQMALAMGAVGNGGINYAPRVALQVQSIDDRLLFGYDVRARDQIEILKPVMKAMREGMTGVVYSGSGTAPAAKVPGVKMAGKTGTAQWGPEKRERVAAWFAGFAPVDKPKYAFAAVYEGVPGNNDVHGGTDGAPIIGRAMREIFAWEQAQEKASQKKEKGKKATNAASDEDQDEPAPRRRRVPRAVPVED
jgi:penicillin-binding protein 2